MTNLTRVTGKTFGETATATGDDPDIGQFGSAKAGTYVGTTDIATIQSLPAWSNGFVDSVTPNTQFPPLPEVTGAMKVLSYQENYLLQKGVAEWDSGTTYYTGDFAKGVGEGKLYVSKVDNNLNHAVTDGTYWEEFSSGASRNIGEIVPSTIPLTDAGLHLLDGALMQYGSYSAFVDYIADLYNDSTKYTNLNIIGSLTDNSGVLSGFSTSNYAKFPVNFQPSTNPWEMVFKVTTGNDVTTTQYICSFQKGSTNETRYATRIGLVSSNLTISVTYNGTAWDITSGTSGGTGSYTILPNTTYYLKYQYTGSAYILSYSLDGESYTQDCYVASTTPMYNSCTYCVMGLWNNGSTLDPWLGSIDLNESYININGSRWWSGVNPSWATNEVQWQQSVTTYGVCGKFIYDSVNNTVRLPKITGIIEGTTDLTALGNLVEAGLPDIVCPLWNETGQIDNHMASGGSGTESQTWSASSFNSIYGNSTTVQPQTIKVLYYIVIATSTKTDIEVDIDEIATDLNGKADVDLTNVNNQGKILMSRMGMPSDTYIDLTLGASGSTYTAPANGWLYLEKTAGTSPAYLSLRNATNGIKTEYATNANSYVGKIYLPVKKSDIISVNYNMTGATAMFRFIYAQGSESEA